MVNLFNRLALALVIAALLLAVVGIFHSALLPECDLISSTAVDDSLFYLVPAQHLLAGQDYSFDGIHRTNGVQPLWALAAIGLAVLSPDRVGAVRLLVASSALLWAAAALIVFLGIRPLHSLAAGLAAILFILAGFNQRIALQGMENGISALSLASFLYLGARRDAKLDCKLACVLALIALCRVEAVMLAGLFGLAALLGAFREGDGTSRFQLRQATLLVLPTALSFGTYLAINLIHFGGLLPISSVVKSFYNQQFLAGGWPFGGFWGNIRFQLTHPWNLGAAPLNAPLEQSLTRAHILVTEPAINVILLGGALAALFLQRKKIASSIRGRPRQAWFLIIWLSYVLLHLALLTFFDPFFTDYGTWYYTPEILTISVALALGLWILAAAAGRWIHLSNSRTFSSVTLAVACLTLLLTNFRIAEGVVRAEPNTSMRLRLRGAGRWMETHLPAGQRVGTLSSGLVGYYAPRQHVINLDGLMNDYDYFRFLKSSQVAQYIDREKITYLADYLAVPAWKGGFNWQGHVGIERMELLRWWVVPDGVYAYCIWRVMPEGSQRTMTDRGPPPADARSKLEFAAAVLGQFPLIDDPALSAYITAHPGSMVASSILTSLRKPFQHVVLTDAQYRSLNWSPESIDMKKVTPVVFADGVGLLGFETPSWSGHPGDDWVYTCFWQSTSAAQRSEREILIIGADGILNRTVPAHGTYPFTRWKSGEVVIDTYRVQIPVGTSPGTYPVSIGIQDPQHNWVPVQAASERNTGHSAVLGYLNVR